MFFTGASVVQDPVPADSPGVIACDTFSAGHRLRFQERHLPPPGDAG